MKYIRCRDVGVDCDFEASGATAEEVLAKCADHAKKEHGMDAIPPELLDKVRAAMREKDTLKAS
jgi:predicted small metal-binding protein